MQNLGGVRRPEHYQHKSTHTFGVAIWDLTMSHCSSFFTFKTAPKIILLTVTLYLIFPLSHRNLGPLFDGRGVDVSYEFARTRRQRFGPTFRFGLRKTARLRLSGGVAFLRDSLAKAWAS